MRIFYTRLTKGEDVIELTGEATMDNMNAAANTAQQLLADGWTFTPPAELLAEARRASIPDPGYRPQVH